MARKKKVAKEEIEEALEEVEEKKSKKKSKLFLGMTKKEIMAIGSSKLEKMYEDSK